MSLTATQKEQCRLQLAEAEAKWVNVAYNDAIGRLTITRRWKVSNDRVDSALEYLNTYGWVSAGVEGTLDTITNPTMGDETFAGTFRQVRCFDGATAESPGWVYQELRRVQAPANETALAALSHLRTQDEAVVRPFGFLHTFSTTGETAGTVTATNGKTWSAACIFYDLSPAAKATVLGFNTATLAVLLLGAGWTYVDRKWEDSADNTGTLVILFQRVEWLNRWTNRRVIAENNPNDTEEGTRTLEAGGISEANLATDYARAKSGWDPATLLPETGKVVEAVSASEGDKGERTIRAQQADVRELISGTPLDSDAKTIHLTPALGIKDATATRHWKRVSKAYKDALVCAYSVGPPKVGLAHANFTCPETGTINYLHVGVSITDHGNDVYTVTQNGENDTTGVMDVHQDILGKGVYKNVTDLIKQIYVRYPIYRHYHIFRTTWLNCWTGCKGKSKGGTYPIVGEISIGSFGPYYFEGRVRIHLGWTDWELVPEGEHIPHGRPDDVDVPADPA